MLRSLEVDELGKRINSIDRLIIRLIHHRLGLAVSVGARKRADKQPIYRRDAENKRIDASRVEGRLLGLDESFVEATMHGIIGESCKQQMINLQKPHEPLPNPRDSVEWFMMCRRNLLKLTEKIASRYEQDYGTDYTASGAYRAYEVGVIDEEVKKLRRKGLAVDLGCATGGQALRLVGVFENVIGFDLSPHMIAQAEKNRDAKQIANAKFEVTDLEHGIPLPDGSASFVFANLGTASDLLRIEAIVGEIERVLEPHGRYLLSFYNKDALVYQWDFLPWPIGLAAEINEELDCLDVHLENQTYLIYGKKFTPSEVKDMLAKTALRGPSVKTFPTISPTLPTQLLVEGNEKAREAVAALDRVLEDHGRGAYIVATGEKVA